MLQVKLLPNSDTKFCKTSFEGIKTHAVTHAVTKLRKNVNLCCIYETIDETLMTQYVSWQTQ